MVVKVDTCREVSEEHDQRVDGGFNVSAASPWQRLVQKIIGLEFKREWVEEGLGNEEI